VESTDEAAFLAGIRAEPKDDLRRLVYADWLDEQNTDESRLKAEYLRLEVHISGSDGNHPERDGMILQLRDAAVQLPVNWKTEVAKVPIENCGVRWRFQCPKKWDQLEVNSGDWTRFCTACRQFVMYCESVEEARQMAEGSGFCVVIDLGVRRMPGDMDLLRGPPELDMGETTVGIIVGDDDFSGGSVSRPMLARPGFLRRVWRRLTGL
jgi:uncharacterized protein (TIGR02996 family)